MRKAFAALGLTTLLLAACQGSAPQQLFQRFQSQARPQGKARAMQAYFGNLHSHTSYSDGILIPREAYRTAAGNGLDFMAVTEHNHAAAGGSDGIWLTPERYEDLKATAREFSVPGKFAALYGQEFSTISSGNHLNIFNADSIVDVPNGDFRTLYEKWLPKHKEVAFIQFNHPNYKADLGLAPHDSDNNTMPLALRQAEERHHQAEALAEARLFPQSRGKSDAFNDYGYDDYGRNFSSLAQAANPYVRTLEILNGPGTSPKPVGKAEADAEEDFFFYLNEGFKIAPSADQDNHYAHWGSLHTGRTGVLAPELTPAAIYEGIRARRVFATEDANLELVLQAGEQYMGSELPAAGPVELTISLRDGDEPQAGYLVQIFADQPGRETARPIVQQQLPPGVGQFKHGFTPPAGESYVFAKVSQLNADGSQDEAWTAPIWFGSARR